MASEFNPTDRQQRRYYGYGQEKFPDQRDQELDKYVAGLKLGGTTAVGTAAEMISAAGRQTLQAYAERAASTAVRTKSEEQLISSLVALVVGGLPDYDPEALMPMAVIEDASRRIGSDLAAVFGRVVKIVGSPYAESLLYWLNQREPESRTLEAMEYEAVEDPSGFYYRSRFGGR